MPTLSREVLYSIWNDIHKTYVLVAGVLLGVGIGVLASNLWPDATIQDVRSESSQYTFINPLLECKNVAFENTNNLSGVKGDVKDSLDNAISEGRINSASVYYRDLNNGPWFDVNRDELYSPASLIKVPLMIALYKVSEVDPSILEKTVTVDEEYTYSEQNFKPEMVLEKGKTYTLKALMERMIINSDNFAYNLIMQNIDQNEVVKVYNDLGVDIAKLNEEDPSGNIITIRDFPGFFRVLFNASYLSRKNSEEALQMLSRSVYDNGLVAGTPADTVVSHKYGERYYSFSGTHQLHDCGIIYNKKSPYLLCIMTKGQTFDELESFIENTTRMIDEQHTNTP